MNNSLVKREDFFVLDKDLKEKKEDNDDSKNKNSKFFSNFFNKIKSVSNPEIKLNSQNILNVLSQNNKKSNSYEENLDESTNLNLKKINLENLEQKLKEKTSLIKKLNVINSDKHKNIKKRKMPKIHDYESESDKEENEKISLGHPSTYDKILLMKLTKNKRELKNLKESIKEKIEGYKKAFFYEQGYELKRIKSEVQENSIPICADVTKYDFKNLCSVQNEIAGKKFDVIMMDPPWQLSTSQPSRGCLLYTSPSPRD